MKVDQSISQIAQAAQTPQSSESFVDKVSDSFSKMFDEVNAMQMQADQKIGEFATSKEKDLHGTMIAMQKADVSLRLLMQVRSKLTTAYQEIMRTQI